MLNETSTYSPPRTWIARWLVEPGRHVPDDIRPLLLAGLFGTLTIFLGGVISTISVSLTSAIHRPHPAFITWAVFEIVIATMRLFVIARARAAARMGKPTATDVHVLLALVWSGGVGCGAVLGLMSDDMQVMALTCASAGAMAGGIALRNFYAPRLAALMIALSLGPGVVAVGFSGWSLLSLFIFQIPIYIVSMWMAAYRLNAMFVRTLAAERENDRRASHDPLTGLSNRSGLERAIEGWRHRADRRGPIAIFYLDLDGFKAVNDRYGHAAGDTLLHMVATRLAGLAPADGLAVRIGGDEFALLVPEADRGATLGKAERVIAAISNKPYDLGEGRSVSIGTSIGIARLPDHGLEVSVLMAAADAALYQAKARGRCRAVLADATPLKVTPLSAVIARRSA